MRKEQLFKSRNSTTRTKKKNYKGERALRSLLTRSSTLENGRVRSVTSFRRF